MSTRKKAPEVNAGSMADIAFLLLIFFLVTTTLETDAGLDRLLPPLDTLTIVDIKERNLLRVSLNDLNQLLVEDDVVDIKELRQLTVDFLDNGGALPSSNLYCDYCQGAKDATSSDNPHKAVISLTHKRETSYGAYIAVQNELVGAYNVLRNREGKRLYGQTYVEMEALYFDEKTTLVEKEKLKNKIKAVQDLFPQKIAEAELSNSPKE
ncbi:biopolymer transporter ExbD [uncultured Croceitalea sp.]|uniref:ExbD/TolR family protein n=1 Tax=uncultured Croceitalea sp. TaxID=1798908 RepID=UPI003305CE7F